MARLTHGYQPNQMILMSSIFCAGSVGLSVVSTEPRSLISQFHSCGTTLMYVSLIVLLMISARLASHPNRTWLWESLREGSILPVLTNIGRPQVGLSTEFARALRNNLSLLRYFSSVLRSK